MLQEYGAIQRTIMKILLLLSSSFLVTGFLSSLVLLLEPVVNPTTQASSLSL
jgi:hypothetical protein